MVADVGHVGGIGERILRDDINIAPVKRNGGAFQIWVLEFLLRRHCALTENHVCRHKPTRVSAAKQKCATLHRRIFATGIKHPIAKLITKVVTALLAALPVHRKRNQSQCHQSDAAIPEYRTRKCCPARHYPRCRERNAVANEHRKKTMRRRKELQVNFLLRLVETRINDHQQSKTSRHQCRKYIDQPLPAADI